MYRVFNIDMPVVVDLASEDDLPGEFGEAARQQPAATIVFDDFDIDVVIADLALLDDFGWDLLFGEPIVVAPTAPVAEPPLGVPGADALLPPPIADPPDDLNMDGLVANLALPDNLELDLALLNQFVAAAFDDDLDLTLLTTPSEAAIPVKYDPRYPHHVNGISGPPMKCICDDAVGTVTAKEVNEGLLEDGGVHEGGNGHVDNGDSVRLVR
ncbi:hypothetical protein Vadar_017859 [Vaccinium darrowii]|uniref:Uncharacterized protein n=1 Tax=Vaccinium darrowii TaxID=229202 RepID=A0ACB7X1P4_9ERIC|nr:hypothetical protein Vadar_017859 [Vaccinium darrowii]